MSRAVTTPTTGQIFKLAFASVIIRPVGAYIFGNIADRSGRRDPRHPGHQGRQP